MMDSEITTREDQEAIVQSLEGTIDSSCCIIAYDWIKQWREWTRDPNKPALGPIFNIPLVYDDLLFSSKHHRLIRKY